MIVSSTASQTGVARGKVGGLEPGTADTYPALDGSACCHWNGSGSSAATRLKGLTHWNGVGFAVGYSSRAQSWCRAPGNDTGMSTVAITEKGAVLEQESSLPFIAVLPAG